jgi:hypothetical protein
MLVNLCFVGAIPTISEFTIKQFPSEIRQEAAAFVKQICHSSTVALQMFISCGGLNVLVNFLEEDLETERELVLIGVNGICSVFELQVRILILISLPKLTVTRVQPQRTTSVAYSLGARFCISCHWYSGNCSMNLVLQPRKYVVELSTSFYLSLKLRITSRRLWRIEWS